MLVETVSTDVEDPCVFNTNIPRYIILGDIAECSLEQEADHVYHAIVLQAFQKYYAIDCCASQKLGRADLLMMFQISIRS